MSRERMTPERYVPTTALQHAVRGRETEVLEALSIRWPDGAPHIRCPYGAHSDHHPSWRWDGRKAKAFCTCIERPHSIFDVVMRIEGLEFEATKLRVAEILGRRDLIETKGGQRMDAASLLQPPADQHDETLGPCYLGHRLGVPPDTVPMPSSSVVGWRELPYYDPPASKENKPAWSAATRAWYSRPWRATAGVMRIASTSRRRASARLSSASGPMDIRVIRRSRLG
jgi:hypothetical protein